MRNLILAGAVLLAAAMPFAASGQDDLIGQLLAKTGEVYADKGFTPTGWEHRGTLAQGEEERLPVTLSGGGQYQIIGVCDSDCADFDIQLLDSNGKEVDKDQLEDDFPIVGTDASGSFTARLTMVACKSGPCNYGVKAFRK